MIYSVLFVYSYLCCVELSREPDLEALFYGVFPMFHHVLLPFKWTLIFVMLNCLEGRISESCFMTF